MKTSYEYEPGTIRWRKHDGKNDVRAYRAPKGWEASAELIDDHPITHRPNPNGAQWWIKETKQ